MSEEEEDRRIAAVDAEDQLPPNEGERDRVSTEMENTHTVAEQSREGGGEGGREWVGGGEREGGQGDERRVEPLEAGRGTGESAEKEKEEQEPAVSAVEHNDEDETVQPREKAEVERDEEASEMVLHMEGEGEGEEEVLEGEGEDEGVVTGKTKERNSYKSQLLKSAGIHLQGSESDSIEGEGVGNAGGELADRTCSSEDRNLEQFSEILLDSDLSPTDSETHMTLERPEDGNGDGDEAAAPTRLVPGEGEGEGGRGKSERRVRFADEVEEAEATTVSSRPGTLPHLAGGRVANNEGDSPKHPGTPVSPSVSSPRMQSPRSPSAPHSPDEIIAGVEYSAQYLGSTPILLTGNASAKSARMQQAQQVVKLFKDPDNDTLPRFPVTVKISSQCIKIADSMANIDLMDHPLYTISYVADIENVLVVMINRITPPSPADPPVGGGDLGGVSEGGGGGEGSEGVERGAGGGGGGEGSEGVERGAGGGGGGEGSEGVERGAGGGGGEGGGGEGDGGQSGIRERGEVEENIGREEEGKEGGEGKGGKGSGEQEAREEAEGDEIKGEPESEGAKKEEDLEEGYNGIHDGPIPRMICHVLETNDARHVAMVIGQAFSVAYKEFLRATGISEAALEQAEYAHILNAQSAPQAELDLLRDRNKTRKLTLAKHKGDMLGMMVMESGYGSALPTPVIAHLSKMGSAARSGQLNIGDQIIAINSINMVGMPVKVCVEQLKKCRYQNVVKMTVVSCPTVVDITIVRPDLKFQLGFTIQDGVVRSLTRGSIAERSGVRVGHYIIEINGTSTVGLTHKDLVHLLTTTVGDLHLRTMPHLMYKLITGQMQPLYH